MHGVAPASPFPLDRWPLARLVAATVVGNAVAVALGYASYMTRANVAALWPATGLLLALLVRCSPSRWALVLGAGFAGQLAFEQLTGRQPLGVSLAFCTVNALEALLAAALLRRWFTGERGIEHVESLIALVLIGAGLAPVVGATLGAAIVVQTAPGVAYWDVWGVWRSADSLGVLLTTPFLTDALRARAEGAPSPVSVPTQERWAWLVCLVLAVELAVGPFDLPVLSVLDFPYLVFLPVIWAAVRFGTRTASGAVLATGLGTVLHARLAHGPFVHSPSPPVQQILDLQSFLTALAATALVALAVAEGRRRSEREREATLHQLFESQRREALGRLAGGLSHDLNNLLSVVAGNAELLAMELAAPELDRGEAGESVSQIRHASARGKAMIGQLLVFSHKQASRPRDTSLNAVLEGLRSMLPHLLGEHYDVRLQLAAEQPMAHLDAARLETALLALLVNARDAMPHGGALTLSTGRDGADSWVAIADSGVGVAPELIERLREPFFTTKEVGKGTGLGLTTVYAIVEADGGRVRIESTLGRGTTVRCSWPAAAAGAVQAASAVASTSAQGSILVCEDDDMVRAVTAKFLASAGYPVREAANGDAALALLRAEAGIRVLVTDVVMPNMNGLALAEAARAIRPALQVLYTSGYPDEVLSEHGITEPLDILHKPFSRDELLVRLRGLGV